MAKSLRKPKSATLSQTALLLPSVVMCLPFSIHTLPTATVGSVSAEVGHRSDREPRALVISGAYVDSDPTTGGGMRRSHVLRGVRKAAAADLYVVDLLTKDEERTMATTFSVRVGGLKVQPRRATRPDRWRQNFTRSSRLALLDTASERRARSDFAAWRRGYDVTVLRVEEYMVLGRLLVGPVVVDMDDLVSQVVRQTRLLLWANAFRIDASRLPRCIPSRMRPAIVTIRRLPRLVARDLGLRLDERRWRSAERHVVRSADVVIVSNRSDLKALGNPRHAVTVPNGFTLKGGPVGTARTDLRPCIAFWGPMTYGPNADGARWFLHEIAPIVKDRVPELRILVIGRGGDLVVRGHEHLAEATGFVDDLTSLLTEVDVAVVPLRMGAGTRIKILEAWANGIPVVSTSVGAHGLDYADGSAFVRADDPDDFAEAIIKVLSDSELSGGLRARGLELAKDLTWENAESLIASLIELQLAPSHLKR